MASLAHTIRIFQRGGLSHNEFFTQVDRVLAKDQTNTAHLLKILSEEHTRVPLPPDVYAEVQRRIAHGVESTQSLADDETRVRTSPGYRAPTNRGATKEPPKGKAGNQKAAEPERMKGLGDTLNGRFVLEECIGFGGMGTVYKALDLRKLEASDRKPYIAIKVLNVQFRGHPKSLIALQREAKKAQALAHPNIVAVYDFDRDGPMVYLTMEYLSGKPLSQTLGGKDFSGLSYVETLHIVSGIARALTYAHEHGFVHCDLKPANVFLTNKGEVKVIDFGIARVFQKPEEEVEATVFDAGSLGGLTPAYASPEMLEHREPDPRDDIYALACITYELLTGRHPFGRVAATQARGAGMKPQRPKKLGHKQWRALKAALSFEREARTPTVARFLREMSGESRTTVYIVLVASMLVIGALFAALLNYYLESRSSKGSEPAVTAAVPAPPAAPEKEKTPPVVVPAAPPAPPPPLPTLTLAAVTPVLARVPCSSLNATVRDHALQVQGYLSKSFGVARLKESLSNIPGATTVAVDVQQVNDDECSVINMFAPYRTGNGKPGNGAAIRTRAPNAELTEGDPLIVDITTPGYDSFVYVDYYVLDGAVVHLVPSPRARGNQAPANYTAAVGSLGNWIVSKPFGNEMIVLLATPAPLFDGVRPEHESKAEYLRAVEKQLGQLAAKYGRDRIAVDFVQITTKAR